MKNRTAIGIVCIILAVAVTFVVSPLVNNISDKKTEVVRFVADVSHGTEIKDTDVEIVKISNSALPEKVIKDKKTVVGKFATADIFKGDFATESKVTDNANTANDVMASLTMELSTGIKLVDKFLEIKKTSDLPTRKTIVFFGTEVLLNAELISDLAYYIREKEKEKNLFVELVLFTNGMIINEKIIRCLRDCNITPIISIDGWAELHDKARKYRNGVGTYAVINDNCKKLMSHNIRFGISTAVGEHNIDFLPDIIKHFYHEFKPINIGLNPMEISSKYSRDVFFEKYIQSGLEAFKIAREFGISIPQIMRRIRPFVEKKCRIKECPTCGGSIRVYPNGTVGTCSHFVAEGNHCIDLETFKKNNLNEVDVFTSWSQRTQFNFEKCKYCEAITLCGGGCVYNAYLQNGDIWTPDNRICTHSKLSLQWCIWDLFDRINGAFKLGDDKNSSLIPTMEERRLIYMNIDENSVKLPLQRYNSFGEIKFEKMEY